MSYGLSCGLSRRMGFIWTRCDSCLWLRSHRCSRYSRRLGAVGSRRRSPYLDAIRLFDGALQYFGFGWPPIHQRLQHILNTSCARRTRRRCPSRMHWHAHAPAKCADGAGHASGCAFRPKAFASAHRAQLPKSFSGNSFPRKKSSQVKTRLISAHSLPPLMAAEAHSIGFRRVVCCLCIDLT